MHDIARPGIVVGCSYFGREISMHPFALVNDISEGMTKNRLILALESTRLLLTREEGGIYSCHIVEHRGVALTAGYTQRYYMPMPLRVT